jgi:hypothetical protein
LITSASLTSLPNAARQRQATRNRADGLCRPNEGASTVRCTRWLCGVRDWKTSRRFTQDFGCFENYTPWTSAKVTEAALP